MGYLFDFTFLILETDLPPIPTVNLITSEPGKIEPWTESEEKSHSCSAAYKNCNCFTVTAAEADIRPLLKKPQCPGSVWLSIAFRPQLKATGGTSLKA